jgi:hypothetical protein
MLKIADDNDDDAGDDYVGVYGSNSVCSCLLLSKGNILNVSCLQSLEIVKITKTCAWR